MTVNEVANEAMTSHHHHYAKCYLSYIALIRHLIGAH